MNAPGGDNCSSPAARVPSGDVPPPCPGSEVVAGTSADDASNASTGTRSQGDAETSQAGDAVNSLAELLTSGLSLRQSQVRLRLSEVFQEIKRKSQSDLCQVQLES